jgi:hypothetical protein
MSTHKYTFTWLHLSSKRKLVAQNQGLERVDKGKLSLGRQGVPILSPGGATASAMRLAAIFQKKSFEPSRNISVLMPL